MNLAKKEGERESDRGGQFRLLRVNLNKKKAADHVHDWLYCSQQEVDIISVSISRIFFYFQSVEVEVEEGAGAEAEAAAAVTAVGAGKMRAEGGEGT